MPALCLHFASNAQVIWTQDFEGVTIPALPTGWVQNSPGAPPGWGWVTNSGAVTSWGPSATGTPGLPAHTQYVYVDEQDHPTNLDDTLFSQVFSVTGYPNPYLNYDYFFYQATNNTSMLTESAYVIGSSDGGTTWAIIDTLFGYGWGGSWVTQNCSLGSLAGANCKVGFVYSDGGSPAANPILGVAVDNIQERNLTADSVHLNSLAYNSNVNGIVANGSPLSFTVTNNGVPATVTVYYTINGGAPVSQTFPASGTITPFSTQTFTFTTAMTGLTSGTNNIHVAISAVNSGAQTATDTMLNSSAVLASGTVFRNGLIEEFSSSTCNPCAYFNAGFDPLCLSLDVDQPGSHFNMLKYQMNWPDWDDDRSYNSDGNTRRGYYSCNSIPDHWVNGVHNNVANGLPLSATDLANYTAQIQGSYADSAFIDMSATYSVDTVHKKVNVKVTATPHFTKTGTYHLYVALADQHYQNRDNEWGQLDYYNVERKMLPSGNGTTISSWTDGTPFTYTDSGVAYVSTDWNPATTTLSDTSLYPTQMSSTFWNNPLLAGELIAFVEEDATKSVMQSLVALPTNGTTGVSVSTLSKITGISIYPNPTSDPSTLTFSLGQSGNVHVKVINYAGETVSEISNTNMAAGMQSVNISTRNIPAGDYIVVITTAGGSNTERLSVVKIGYFDNVKKRATKQVVLFLTL